jgi:hypothetical protein
MERLGRMATTLVVLLVLGGIFISTTLQAAGADGPTFFVRDNQVDLGEHFEGVDIAYEFIVRNNGIGELHIINVKPG